MLSTVTLSMIDYLYRPGLAETIVTNNIIGLFTITRPREPLYKDAIQLTAQQFVGRFGSQLSIFGMLLYFANYLTEYKNSYSQFDLTDVLRQCSKMFLPRWRDRLGLMERHRQRYNERCEETGHAALIRYLRREYIAKGEDVRKAPVVVRGKISEEELRFIESGEELIF
ncbi:MAG: hypothetical protein IKN29_05690 [Bacteroidales bacterium]|nr:hypothetical protein [Bacteroidales bacterium]